MYLISLFFASFLCIGMAHAVRYGGSCGFEFEEGQPIGNNVQEKKSSIFTWEYDPAGTQVQTSMGNSDQFGIMADTNDLDFVVLGPFLATPLNPIYIVRRADEPKKATLIVDRGFGYPVITYDSDNCNYWVHV